MTDHDNKFGGLSTDLPRNVLDLTNAADVVKLQMEFIQEIAPGLNGEQGKRAERLEELASQFLGSIDQDEVDGR